MSKVPCPRLAVPSKGMAGSVSVRVDLSIPCRPIGMELGGVRQLHNRPECWIALMAGDPAGTLPLREFEDSRGGPSWHSLCHIPSLARWNTMGCTACSDQ